MATAKIATRKRSNGTEFYQVQIRGKGVAKPYSKSFDNLSDAEAYQAEQMVILSGETVADNEPVKVSHSLASLAGEYLEWWRIDLKTGKQKKSYNDHSKKFYVLVDWFKDTPVEAIDQTMLEAFKLDFFKKVKPCTVRQYLTKLQTFLTWVNTYKKIEVTECINKSFLPPNSDRREKVFTEQEYKALCAWAYNKRAWLEPIVMLAWETAMRRNEILALVPEWIDLKGKVINLPKEICKNGESRQVPLSQIAVILLEALIEGKKPKQPLFYVTPNTLSNVFKLACEELDINEGVFHSMRHTSISRYAKKPGMNAMLLSTISGHKDLAMLQKYFHGDASYTASLMD